MPESLFSAFAPNTYQEWLDKVGKDLRGKPIESLDSFTSDGFRIHPLFSSDFPNQPISDQPISEQPAWTIVEEFIVSNEQETNKLALDKLNRGATGLLFYVYEDVNDLSAGEKLIGVYRLEKVAKHKVEHTLSKKGG